MIAFLNAGYKGRVANINEIVTIEVSQNSVAVELSNEEEPVIVRGSLVKCLRKLPAEVFFKANRSCMVNLAQITKVNSSSKNMIFVMKNGRKVVVSRKQSSLFRRQFSL